MANPTSSATNSVDRTLSPTSGETRVDRDDAEQEVDRAGRLLAGLRKREERVCVVCGTTSVGTARRRYCSAACRLKADYARHAEQRKAARRERYRREREQE